MRALLAATLLATASGALGQILACKPAAPRTDPGTGFVVAGGSEQILARGGNSGPGWEWALDNVKGDLDWTSGVAFQWTVTYAGTGSATLEVRNQGAVVLSLTRSAGMQAGNALHMHVSTNSSIGAETTVTASATSINGHLVSGTISQTGNNQYSAKNLYFYFPAMTQGFSASGIVTLTYSRLPTGSRVDFQLRSGNVPCNNHVPTITVSAPAEGSLHQAGSAISLAANAQDADGTVAQVEFLANGSVIGVDTSAPFSFDWTNAAAGNHAITARATDNAGDRTTSTAINLTVNAQPTVSIGNPPSSTVVQAPANVTLESTAADSDGTVTKVDFYQGGALVGTDTTSPYSFSLANLLSGPYTFTAVASDDRGGTGTSAAVTVFVNARPAAALKSPAQNSLFTAPASIPVAAEASDTDGTIASVEFYNGATLITTLTAAPYSFVWTDVPQGSYSLTAKVLDNHGGTVISDAVDITVNTGVAKLHFIHVDHLNTPRLVANQSGQTVWRWDQAEPFGNNPADENPTGVSRFDLPLRLPGQYFDKETNLHHNYFRTYDPSVGRYTRSDPIGLQGGLNTYAYVHSNPLSLVDPEGLEVQVICRPVAFWGSELIFERRQKHCFVRVRCPEEEIDVVLSLFAVRGPFEFLPSSGMKSLARPGDREMRDNPASPANDAPISIVPRNDNCAKCCRYEKEVLSKFKAFPSGLVPYDSVGWNSNSFVDMLITSTECRAAIPAGSIRDAPGFGIPR